MSAIKHSSLARYMDSQTQNPAVRSEFKLFKDNLITVRLKRLRTVWSFRQDKIGLARITLLKLVQMALLSFQEIVKPSNPHFARRRTGSKLPFHFPNSQHSPFLPVVE